MKILVAIKRVIDYKTRVQLKADKSGVETNVKMSINPFDEIALEEALRLKEKNTASEIIIVSIGNDATLETLRSGLAFGADRAILVKTEAQVEPLAAAKILKKVAENENVQLILLGKQAIDTDNNQVGQMLAGLLNWPQGTFASALHFHDEGVSVTREIDGGLETLFLKLPALITTDLRLNEPRYISLPNIVKAKQKQIAVILSADLNIDTTPRILTLEMSMPDKKRRSERVENVKELVKCLKEEAQVI